MTSSVLAAKSAPVRLLSIAPNPTESMRKRKHLSVPVAELSGLRRVAAVAARNVYWGRSHGWANLLEEHDLNLRVRAPRELRKFLWRRRSPSPPGTARPVFVVGVQRSGTNMLTHGLAMSPEFEVYNEGNRRAFANYRLRDDHIAALVSRSRHCYVLFKPLVDSHRIRELLDDLGTETPPRRSGSIAMFEEESALSSPSSGTRTFGSSAGGPRTLDCDTGS